MSIDPHTINNNNGKPENLPFGLLSFNVTVANPGDVAEVVVYLSRPAKTGEKWYKYDSAKGWQDYSAHSWFSGDRGSVTLELQDGGYGDADGIANGIIVDPSGLGSSEESSSGSGGGGGGCFIATAAYGSPVEPHVVVLRKVRDRFLLTHGTGKTFVHLYYTLSPPMAAFIEKHENLRAIVHWSLLPLIWVSWGCS